MGMTIAEKIIAAAAGVDSVKPGDIHTVQLDRLMSNDGTTHLTVDMYKIHTSQIQRNLFSSLTTTYRLTARRQQHPRRR